MNDEIKINKKKVAIELTIALESLLQKFWNLL